MVITKEKVLKFLRMKETFGGAIAPIIQHPEHRHNLQ